MSEEDPASPPMEAPVDPLYTHPASPFIRTEVPASGGYPPPPGLGQQPAIYSTWVLYRSQFELGLAILAYLMVLVGSVTVLQANPQADWRYYITALPVLPAALVIWLFVRTLARLEERKKRIQMHSFGFALGTTALLTFGYGFFEGAGLPHLNWTFVVPLMAVLWALGTAVFSWRYR